VSLIVSVPDRWAVMREPTGTKDSNAWFVRTALTRNSDRKFTSKEPLPFPIVHQSADHRFRDKERALNFEYGFKRQPVDHVFKFLSLRSLGVDEDPRIVQHLSLAQYDAMASGRRVQCGARSI
jgi:hypothetical protein